MIDLQGKVALVTGASRGIGRACAIRFAELGADVIVNFLSSRDEASAVVGQIQELGRTAIAIRADVANPEDIQAMIGSIEDRFGSLDIIVSNAAAGGFRPATQLKPTNVEAALRTNALPVVWLAQAAAKMLAQRDSFGKVIAISSHGSMWAVPNYAAIGASKAALESFVRHLALELGPTGINFNCVLPGIVATEAVRTMPGVEQVLKAAGERMMLPTRTLSPDDIAGVVAFLASSDSDLIQGQTIVVDGGVSVRA